MFDLPPTVEVNPGLSSDACVIRAAQHYGVAPDLMLAVRSLERGVPGQSVSNTDGSRDHNEPGLNTRTLQELERRGWDVDRLQFDGCYAMYAASYWMRQKLVSVADRDLPLMTKAARYNSATAEHNAAYQIKLKPYLADWGCYLHVFWKSPPKSLFSYASGVLNDDNMKLCKQL